jgi:hypothetical protein
MNLLLIFNNALTLDERVIELEEIFGQEFVQCKIFEDRYESVYSTQFTGDPFSLLDIFDSYYWELTNLGYKYLGVDRVNNRIYVGWEQ